MSVSAVPRPDGVTGPTDTEAQTAEAAAAATAEALGGEGFGGDYGAFGGQSAAHRPERSYLHQIFEAILQY